MPFFKTSNDTLINIFRKGIVLEVDIDIILSVVVKLF